MKGMYEERIRAVYKSQEKMSVCLSLKCQPYNSISAVTTEVPMLLISVSMSMTKVGDNQRRPLLLARFVLEDIFCFFLSDLKDSIRVFHTNIGALLELSFTKIKHTIYMRKLTIWFLKF